MKKHIYLSIRLIFKRCTLQLHVRYARDQDRLIGLIGNGGVTSCKSSGNPFNSGLSILNLNPATVHLCEPNSILNQGRMFSTQ